MQLLSKSRDSRSNSLPPCPPKRLSWQPDVTESFTNNSKDDVIDVTNNSTDVNITNQDDVIDVTNDSTDGVINITNSGNEDDVINITNNSTDDVIDVTNNSSQDDVAKNSTDVIDTKNSDVIAVKVSIMTDENINSKISTERVTVLLKETTV